MGNQDRYQSRHEGRNYEHGRGYEEERRGRSARWSPAGDSYSSSEGSESDGRNYSDQERSGYRDNMEGRGAQQSRPYGGGGFSSFSDRGGEADSFGGGEGDFRSMQGQQQRGSWTSKDWGVGYGGSRESGQGRGEGRAGYGRMSHGSDYGYGGRGAESFGERDSSSSMRGKGPKGYTRSDERIKEDMCERFSDDDFLDASDIEISVDDGEVTLSGEVTDRRAKRMAEDIAEECSGVKNVQNNLRVKRETTADQNSSTQQAGGSQTESSKRASGGS